MNFREFLHLQERNTVGTHNDTATGSFITQGGLPSSPEGHGALLPTQVLQPNLAVRQGRVISLGNENEMTPDGKPTRNPIPVVLDGGTRLQLTWNQYQRIGEPKVGDHMTVQFLRLSDDDTPSPSGIHSIEVRGQDGVKKYNNWPH